MIAEVILDMIYKPNTRLGETEDSDITALKAQSWTFFCSHIDFSQTTKEFFKKNKSNVLVCYYFLRILGYLINIDKQGEEELLTIMKDLLHNIEEGPLDIDGKYEAHLQEFEMICEFTLNNLTRRRRIDSQKALREP